MQVIITDTRKDWMIAEDEQMACMTGCVMFHRCRSRMGYECKHLGGSEIPKVG